MEGPAWPKKVIKLRPSLTTGEILTDSTLSYGLLLLNEDTFPPKEPLTNTSPRLFMVACKLCASSWDFPPLMCTMCLRHKPLGIAPSNCLTFSK